MIVLEKRGAAAAERADWIGMQQEDAAYRADRPHPASRGGAGPGLGQGQGHQGQGHQGQGQAFARGSAEILRYEDFDRPPPPPEPEVIAPTFSAAELEAARKEAFQDGRTAAAEEAASADHAANRQLLTAIAAQLAATRDELFVLAEQSATSIAQLLLHSLGAVVPQLAAQYGEAELRAIIRTILPGLFQEPTATLRLHPRHCAAIAQEIEQHDPDLATRLQIVPTQSMPPGDLRIAWRNGGATRDAAALWAEVEETLALAGLAPLRAATREIEHAG